MANRPVLLVQLGHCYRKVGSTGTTGEQVHVTKVGRELDRRGNAHGLNVRLLLADERVPRVSGRVAFVALHCDGSVSSSARGASVGYRNNQGRELGQAWKRMHARHGFPGGFRGDNYTAALRGYYGTGWALSQGIEDAIILELGFLTNPLDRAWLTQPANIARQAEAILRAVATHLGVRPPARPSKPPKAPKEVNVSQVIKRGDEGNVVALVQRCVNAELKVSGREVKRLKVDGDYGAATEDAVRAYQRGAGLDATGVVDGFTAALLFRYDPGHPAPASAADKGKG